MKLYLNNAGEYILEDSVRGLAVAKMQQEVEKRVTQLNRAFKLNVDGLCVVGHTCLDPLNRLAYEWDVVGTTTEQDLIEEAKSPERCWDLPKQTRHLRAVIATTVKKPWWAFWG